MKNSRLRYTYSKNASKLHQKVGDLLRSGKTFAGQHEAYQEYPVNKVNVDYQNGSYHFDWVIPHLKVVIEVHGEQHFYPVAFDGDYEAAVAGFGELKARDAAKKEAALAAGFIYIMIPYNINTLLNENWLAEAYDRGQRQLEKYNEEHEEKQQTISIQLAKKKKDKQKEVRQKYIKSERHQEELRLARESRKRHYRKLKELKQKQDGTRP